MQINEEKDLRGQGADINIFEMLKVIKKIFDIDYTIVSSKKYFAQNLEPRNMLYMIYVNIGLKETSLPLLVI